MRKIGIITILKCNNYGADLQAYAAQRIFREMGYDAEIIDYLYFKNPRYKSSTRSQSIFSRSLFQRIKTYLKYNFINKLINVLFPLLSHKLNLRVKRFNQFHEINSKLSSVYSSIDSLYKTAFNYDVYVSGSDQIWNPYTETNIAPYFLDFAPSGAKKISFASSFGVQSIPSFANHKFSQWLSSYSHLSCREDTGVKIIKELTGKEAVVCLDPTLLLNKDQWLDVKGYKEKELNGYVLIYEVGHSEYIRRLAELYSKERSIPIYRICLKPVCNGKDKGITNIIDAGPADFVYMFAHASYILTNSFHGTAFACNFGKNFNTVLSKAGKRNSRMSSLLTRLGLNDRIIWEEDDFPKTFANSYNGERVQSILESERVKSIEFLRTAIEN